MNKSQCLYPWLPPPLVPGQRNHTRILFCSPGQPHLPRGHMGSAIRGADTGQSPGLIPGELSLQRPESLCSGKLQSAPLNLRPS